MGQRGAQRGLIQSEPQGWGRAGGTFQSSTCESHVPRSSEQTPGLTCGCGELFLLNPLLHLMIIYLHYAFYYCYYHNLIPLFLELPFITTHWAGHCTFAIIIIIVMTVVLVLKIGKPHVYEGLPGTRHCATWFACLILLQKWKNWGSEMLIPIIAQLIHGGDILQSQICVNQSSCSYLLFLLKYFSAVPDDTDDLRYFLKNTDSPPLPPHPSGNLIQ